VFPEQPRCAAPLLGSWGRFQASPCEPSRPPCKSALLPPPFSLCSATLYERTATYARGKFFRHPPPFFPFWGSLKKGPPSQGTTSH